MKLQTKYKSLFEKYGVTSKLRISHLMAQIEHESKLKPISENLNYSAEGLLSTFKKYFTKETALACERKPQAIANVVYAKRMGNTNPGDGWKYRGRGFIQITGKENYTKLSKDTGIDFVNNPDLLLEEANSMISALWFWKKINGNALADKDDIKSITKAINGGYNGLEERIELLNKYKSE